MNVPTRAAVLTNLRRGTLEFCVLAYLAHEPAYGLDIARRLGAKPVLLESEGTLYPLLSRLRKSGWVVTRWEESESGSPRRYYALTDDGRTALDAFARTWDEFRDSVDAVLREGKR
ncbi:PadR family transcriptional regulator [Georgenia yuyongxinii]